MVYIVNNLKKYQYLYLLLTIFVVLFLFLLIVFEKNKPKGPVIHFKQDYFDAGTITGIPPAVVDHCFDFKNTGTKPLKIYDIKTTCSCTVVEKPENFFSPGQKGGLKSEVRLGSMGKQTNEILVYTNAANSPHKLIITAKFEPDIAITTSLDKIRFQEIELGNPKSIEFAINVFSKDITPLTISSIQSKNSIVSANILETSSSTQRNSQGYYMNTFRLNVLPEPKRAGDFEDSLTFNFQPQLAKSLIIQITGNAVASFILKPEKVLFISKIDDGLMAQKKTIYLRHIAQKQIFVEEISNPFSWLDITYSTKEDKKILTLILQPKDKPNTFEGNITITVKTENSISQALQIPIIVRTLNN